MNRFLICTDEQLKIKLKEKGFKVLKQEKFGTVFALDEKIKFNFDSEDRTKYMFTNKLTF